MSPYFFDFTTDFDTLDYFALEPFVNVLEPFEMVDFFPLVERLKIEEAFSS